MICVGFWTSFYFSRFYYCYCHCFIYRYERQKNIILTFLRDELRTVPTNSKVFLRGLLNMREKQILTSVIEVQKENWG